MQRGEEGVIEMVDMGTQTEEVGAALGEFETGDVRAGDQTSVGINTAKALHFTEVVARYCSRGDRPAHLVMGSIWSH